MGFGRLASPAAGCRQSSSGALHSIALIGYYWASAGREDNRGAFFLSFTNSGLNPQGNDYRVSGRSVRCLQE